MKKVFVILLALIALIVVSVLFFFKSDTKNPYEKIGWGRFNEQSELDKLPDDFGKDMAKCDYSVPEAEIPTFKEIDFPFSNQFDNTKSLPLMAAAMIDLDNDGVDEVFVSGGITQEDVIFK